MAALDVVVAARIVFAPGPARVERPLSSHEQRSSLICVEQFRSMKTQRKPARAPDLEIRTDMAVSYRPVRDLISIEPLLPLPHSGGAINLER